MNPYLLLTLRVGDGEITVNREQAEKIHDLLTSFLHKQSTAPQQLNGSRWTVNLTEHANG
jgi:hypothetical protein